MNTMKKTRNIIYITLIGFIFTLSLGLISRFLLFLFLSTLEFEYLMNLTVEKIDDYHHRRYYIYNSLLIIIQGLILGYTFQFQSFYLKHSLIYNLIFYGIMIYVIIRTFSLIIQYHYKYKKPSNMQITK